ncbi:response regulator [Spirochaeta dissipatitropha]
MNALIVEDSRAQQLLVKEYLKMLNISADIAEDGASALQCIESKAYDLIICDIILPQMDGIELIRKIRKQCNYPVKIIAVSGGLPGTVQGSLETAKIAGASAVLPKPFQKQTLHTLIKQLSSSES